MPKECSHVALDGESKISLNRACKLPALSRDGIFPNLSTVWRWHARGVRGVRLETAMIGGRLMTSAAAVDRFIGRLSLTIPAGESR